MTSSMQEKYLDKTCTVCEEGLLKEPEENKEWYLVCSECHSIHLVYEPLPHQVAFHDDNSKIKLFAGGYGSGKTTTTVFEMVYLQITTPNGTSLMGAATFPQLEQTSMKEWFEIIPTPYIKHHNKAKNYVDLINGHRVLFRSLDDPGKARSLNLCFAHIEEASEVKYEYYDQLLNRLRNRATDNHKLILSTNPDAGWIRSEILLKARIIHNSEINYGREQNVEKINKNISVHIAPTHLNTYLPPTYYEDTARGKENWWISRFLHGSFENKSGLVYPMLEENIVDRFEIPKNWERLMAADFGLRDPTVALWGAIDPVNGVVYIYDEHYEAEKPINYHARKMNERNENIAYGMLRQPLGDPKGKARSETDNVSIYDHYAEYGVYFRPGINKIEDGIYKVFTYFSLGKLKIFENCKNLIREGLMYKYPDRSLDDKKNATEKPVEKDDHSLDTLKYLVSDLADNPFDLVNASFSSVHVPENSQAHLPHALQDDDDPYGSGDWSNIY